MKQQLHSIIKLIQTNYEEGLEQYKSLDHQSIKENWFYEKLLFYSCEANKKDLLELMLQQSNHRMHRQDVKGRTLLIISILHDSYECIDFLVKLKDYKMKISDKQGNTFFHYLVQREYSDFYNSLFNASVVLFPDLINAKNLDGETPLHLACLKGSQEFVRMLVEHSASLYATTKENVDVITYAYQSEKNSEDIVNYLELQMSLFPETKHQRKNSLKSRFFSGIKEKSPSPRSSPEQSPSPQMEKSDDSSESETNSLNNSTESKEIKENLEQLSSPPKSSSWIPGFFQKKQPEPPKPPKEEVYKHLLQSIPLNTIKTIIPPKTNDVDPSKKKFRIISVDGGGIKCLLQNIIFSRLVEKFPTLFDDVDLYCGVSASSFICCQLALGMIPSDIQMLLLELCKHTFTKKSRGLTESLYCNKYLINVAEMTFGDKKLTDIPNKVFINAFQIDTGADNPNRTCKACTFNNFIPGHDCKISDAILRSAAAVGYFPPYQGYADGGIFENNPVSFAFPYIFGENGLHVPVENAVCLSISSGRAPVTHFDVDKYSDAGMVQLLPIVMNGFFWSRKSMADEVAKGFLGDKYMRLDPILPDNIDLDNAQHIATICELAEKIDISHIEEWIIEHWF